MQLFDGLIVTPGSSDANSLLSLDEFDSYIAASFYDKTAYSIMSDTEKTSLLILTGITFNAFSWLGYEVYEDQAMAWPRWLTLVEREIIHTTLGPVNYDGVSDYEGPWSGGDVEYTAETAVFPEQIKCACAWYAYDVYYRSIQGRTSPGSGPAADALKSYSMFGDVSMSFDTNMEIPLRDITSISGLLRGRCPEIWTLMSPFVTEVRFMGSDWQSDGPKKLDAFVSGEFISTT
jgi:hypothetical protein